MTFWECAYTIGYTAEINLAHSISWAGRHRYLNQRSVKIPLTVRVSWTQITSNLWAYMHLYDVMHHFQKLRRSNLSIFEDPQSTFCTQKQWVPSGDVKYSTANALTRLNVDNAINTTKYVDNAITRLNVDNAITELNVDNTKTRLSIDIQ